VADLDRLPADAVETAVAAVRRGDQDSLATVLAAHPTLVAGPLPGHDGRSLLHIATDWPGHCPDVAATIARLVEAGADVDARSVGDHTETPMHWAASSDDTEAVAALLDAGADIDAPGAAALGMTDAVAAVVASGEAESLDALLWGACHGGRLETATLLVDAGADVNWRGWDGLTPLGAAERSGATELVHWLRDRGASP